MNPRGNRNWSFFFHHLCSYIMEWTLQRMFSKHVCVGKPASSLRDLEVKHRDYIILYWQQQSLADMLSGPFALLVSSSSCTYSSVQNETPSVGTRGKSWVCQWTCYTDYKVLLHWSDTVTTITLWESQLICIRMTIQGSKDLKTEAIGACYTALFLQGQLQKDFNAGWKNLAGKTWLFYYDGGT